MSFCCISCEECRIPGKVKIVVQESGPRVQTRQAALKLNEDIDRKYKEWVTLDQNARNPLFIFFQGVQRSSGAYARLEHSRRTSGPGTRALATFSSSQQILALRPGSDLHSSHAYVFSRQWNSDLDI